WQGIDFTSISALSGYGIPSEVPSVHWDHLNRNGIAQPYEPPSWPPAERQGRWSRVRGATFVIIIRDSNLSYANPTARTKIRNSFGRHFETELSTAPGLASEASAIEV